MLCITFRSDFHVGWKNQKKYSTLSSSFDALLKWHDLHISRIDMNRVHYGNFEQNYFCFWTSLFQFFLSTYVHWIWKQSCYEVFCPWILMFYARIHHKIPLIFLYTVLQRISSSLVNFLSFIKEIPSGLLRFLWNILLE